MVNLYCLVGLPGSGKSFYAKQLLDENPNAVLIESDSYREKNYGSAKKQGDNHSLFDEIHADIISALSSGKDVIFDATNISYKHRIAFLGKIKKIDCQKIALVMATQYSICLENNKKRERVVPEFVIERMRKNFTCPQYNEGWNNIRFVFNYDREEYYVDSFQKKAHCFNQDNPFHTKDLLGHSTEVAWKLIDEDAVLFWSGYFHDCGKIYCKTFVNKKGEKTDVAHYYEHEYISSYESMFYLNNLYFSEEQLAYGCGLVQYHMRGYGTESERSRAKLLGLLGQKMYNDVMSLHKADKNAH